MEHEAEYEKLVGRGDYYDELLRMGHVVARVVDTKAWREEIKAKARADKIRVRTGVSNQDDHVAWAYLQHLEQKQVTVGDEGRLADHLDAVQEAFDRAALRGHKITRRRHAGSGRLPRLGCPSLC